MRTIFNATNTQYTGTAEFSIFGATMQTKVQLITQCMLHYSKISLLYIATQKRLRYTLCLISQDTKLLAANAEP